jgi:serine/threonine protein kinase
MAKVGDRIGPYVLVDKLGRGAFGVVWLAEKRGAILTNQAALKMPNDEDVDLEAVRQEAEVWKLGGGHANVLPIIDADVYDGQVVFVSEYAPDGSLSTWLRRHGGIAPAFGAAARMVEGILAGLEHLHSRNIIHRDLKPDNILLQGETPRLADFGIARVIKSTNPYSVTISGIPYYMAPEVYRGKRTEQTDLWAVGVILYQLLAGSLPFQQEDPHSLMYAVLTEQPAPLPASTPGQLRDLVAKSLEKDEGRRFRTAGEMRQALARASAGAWPEELPPTLADMPQAQPQPPTTRGVGWDELSFFEEAGNHLKPHELEAVRRLYDYSVKSAHVTWGRGAKKGTFNAKFNHVNSKSVYSVATNGDLYLNFAWLADSAAGAETAKQLGQKLRRLRGFNLPDNYPERYITVPTARWVDQVDEFTSAIDDVVRPHPGGQVSVTEEGEEETVIKLPAGHAVEFTGDDEAYLRWLSQNPEGYVVNTTRAINPNTMVLHRSTCPHISKLEFELRGGFTERGYVKICSARVEPLREWVRRHGRGDGSFSRECNSCRPLSTPTAADSVEQLQLEYWTLLGNLLREKHSVINLKEPRAQYSITSPIGHPQAELVAAANTKDGRIAVGVWIHRRKDIFRMLENDKDEIEREMAWHDPHKRQDFLWLENEGEVKSDIWLRWHGANIRERARWPEFLEWHWKNLEAFYNVFEPRLREINSGKDSLKVARINDPVMAISIGGQYPNARNDRDLYHATRGAWRIDRRRAETAEYAFAVYKGIVKEVYKINEWRPASPELYGILERLAGRQDDESPVEGDDTRSEFVGGLAPEAIREKYVGKRLPKRSYGSPVLYFNC